MSGNDGLSQASDPDRTPPRPGEGAEADASQEKTDVLSPLLPMRMLKPPNRQTGPPSSTGKVSRQTSRNTESTADIPSHFKRPTTYTIPSTPEREAAFPAIDWDKSGTRSRYLDLIRDYGYIALIDEIVHDDLQENDSKIASPLLVGANTNRVPSLHGRSQAAVILYFMTPQLIEALIEGDLMSQLQTPAFSKYLPKQTEPPPKLPGKPGRPAAGAQAAAQKPSENRPCIYGFFHTDELGNTPSKKQYMQLLENLNEYLKDADRYLATPRRTPQLQANQDLIARVDMWMNNGKPNWMNKHVNRKDIEKEWLAGARRYLSSQAKIENVKSWAGFFRQRLELIPDSKEDEPIPWAVSEVGWTITPTSRRLNHEMHTNSNELMNVFEALAAVTMNQNVTNSRHRFRMRWQILYQVFDNAQTEVSEHLLSRLAGSYYFLGGLNMTIGGVRVETAGHLPGLVWDHWKEAQAKRAKDVVAVYMADKKKLEAEWDDIDMIREVRDNKEKLDQAKKELEALKQQLTSEEQKASGEDHKMESAMEAFYQVVWQDVKAAKTAEEMTPQVDELEDIMNGLSDLWEAHQEAEEEL